ncbi:MAG TPA: phage holin family protein [Clostridiaceae bacterium]|nr:phage holin family protein [Clostridiaceae bacterium]
MQLKPKGCDLLADQFGETTRNEPFNITHFLIRFVVGAVVLAITAALTPGFRIAGIWPLILGAIVLALLDYFVAKLLGVDATPFGRGITGFILAAAIIYVTQFFVSGYQVTLWGAIIGALVYGIVDLIIPGKSM